MHEADDATRRCVVFIGVENDECVTMMLDHVPGIRMRHGRIKDVLI